MDSMSIYLISDLHLDQSLPGLTSDLRDFIESKVHQGDELYILGDFFNVWLGDDHQSTFNSQIISLIKGCLGKVYIMHGNRDFLLAGDFCQQANCELIADPSIVEFNGEKVLLMHGDSLCTEDAEYMKAREHMRSSEFKSEFLSQSIDERQAFADKARAQSKAHTRETSEDIMDVTPSEVSKIMEDYGVLTLIHGHTHRPAVHRLKINGKAAQRIVLGDWDSGTWFCRADQSGVELLQFP